MFRWIVLIACLLAALSGLAVGVMNPEVVQVELPGLTFELALGSMLMLTFACGLMAGLILHVVLFSLPARFKKRRAGSATEGRLPERHG